MNQPFRLYYFATVIFVLIDYVLGVNLRIAFLEPYPVARILYYGACFGCLVLIVLRPRWAAIVGGVESLIALMALTVSIMSRILVVTDEMIDTGTGYVSFEELGNYAIVGSIAYLSWIRGVNSLKAPKITEKDFRDW